MANKVRIWHISDLHMGAKALLAPVHMDVKVRLPGDIKRRTQATTRVVESFWKRLETELDSGLPDFVVVSGDISTHGDESVFREARDKLNQIAALIRSRTPGGAFDAKRIVVVPGNHDVSRQRKRTDPEPSVAQRYHSFVADLGAFTLPAFSSNDSSAAVVNENVLLYALNSTPICGQFATPSDELESSIKVLSRSCNDVYANEALESVLAAWLRYDPPLVDERELELMRQEIAKKDPTQQKLRIAVLHHHLVPHKFQSVEVKPFEIVVNAGEVLDELKHAGVHIVLHGHKHIAAESTVSLGDGPPINVWAAPSAAGEYFANIADAANGFVVIEAEFADNSAKVDRKIVRLNGAQPETKVTKSIELRPQTTPRASSTESVRKLGNFPEYLTLVAELLEKANPSDRIRIACDYPAPAVFTDAVAHARYHNALVRFITTEHNEPVGIVFCDKIARDVLQEIQFGNNDDFVSVAMDPRFRERYARLRAWHLEFRQLGLPPYERTREWALQNRASILQALSERQDAYVRSLAAQGAHVTELPQALTTFCWIVGNRAVSVVSELPLPSGGLLQEAGFPGTEHAYYSEDEAFVERLKIIWNSYRALAQALPARDPTNG